jgi:Ca2+-binding RTX toxin-like protein
LAFTTTTGAGGTSLIGTSGVDATSLAGNQFPLFIGAQAANDVVTLTGSSQDITAELGQGADTFVSAALSSSTVAGGAGNDSITFSDTLTGGLIQGNDGVDSITVAAVRSSALVNANAGNDVINIGGALTSASVLGGADNDTITLTASVAITSSSKVNGNKGNDTLALGNLAANMSSSTIFGGEGNDLFTITAGAAGNVILSGDDGNDTVVGAAGADTLYGGDGNDVITGAAGANVMSGGAGADIFNNTLTAGLAIATAAGAAAGATNAFTVTGALEFGYVTDFTNSDDKVSYTGASWGNNTLTAQSNFTTLIGGGVYAITGTLSSDKKTFTAAATANAGTDTLLIQVATGGTTLVGATAGVVLQGANTSLFGAGNLAVA